MKYGFIESNKLKIALFIAFLTSKMFARGHFTIVLITITTLVAGCSNIRDKKPARSNSDTLRSNSSNTVLNYPDSIKNGGDGWSYERSFILENYLIASLPDTNFLVIDKNAAIFIEPDSSEVEQMKREVGEENFYIGSDDNGYYYYLARKFSEKQNLPVINPSNRYLKFIGINNAVFCFDTKAKAARGWTTILFRPDSLPKIINPVDIESEYKLYFGRDLL